MNPKEYQQKALRTLNPSQQFWTKQTKQEEEQAHRELLINTALGLAGEASEIHNMQVMDEFGDAYWYAYIFMKAIGLQPFVPMPAPDDTKRAKEASPAALLLYAGIICEEVKKHLYHGKHFDDCLPIWTEAIMEYVYTIATIDPSGYEATFAKNIEKLKKRYPEGFDQ